MFEKFSSRLVVSSFRELFFQEFIVFDGFLPFDWWKREILDQWSVRAIFQLPAWFAYVFGSFFPFLLEFCEGF